MFFLQFLLGFSIIIIEIKRKKAKVFDVLAIINLIYFICYVVAPISGYFMLDNWQQYSIMRYTYKGINYNSDIFYFSGFVALLGYLIFIVSYYAFKPKSNYKFLDALFTFKVNRRKTYRLGIALFSFSFFFLFISSLNFGGFMKWLIANPRLHGLNDADTVESNSWFYEKAIRLMIFSSYIFWGLMKLNVKKYNNVVVDKNTRLNNYFLIFFLVTSFLLSIAIVIHSGGRLFFFQYIAVFIIATMYLNKNAFSFKKATFLISFGVLVVLYARTFFQYFIDQNAIRDKIDSTEGGWLESYFSFINNYTFPFYATSNNLTYGFYDFNYFMDLFTWPLQFLPPSIRPDNLPDSTAINTYRLLDLENTRFIPSDILSYGIINGGVLGVLIVVVLFGILVKIINKYTNKLNNPLAVIVFVALSFIIGFRIMYFDPYHLFKGSFEFFLSLFCIYFINRGNVRLIKKS